MAIKNDIKGMTVTVDAHSRVKTMLDLRRSPSGEISFVAADAFSQHACPQC